MKKSATTDDTVTLRNFYHPHHRIPYEPQLVDHKTGELFTPERRVKQSFVKECDINNILKQYSATGQISHISAKAAQGAYLDLPDEVDFQTSLQIVRDGETAFATLPSKTRDRFGNDPAQFLMFMADPANMEEAIKLGLATKSLHLGTSDLPALPETKLSTPPTTPTPTEKS